MAAIPRLLWTTTTRPGAARRSRVLLAPLLLLSLAACGDDPVDLQSLDPGDCIQAGGLNIAGSLVTWDDVEEVDCDGPHNGTVIGDAGDGELCSDVYALYVAEVEVPADAIVTGTVGNCVVFSEAGEPTGGYVDPDDE